MSSPCLSPDFAIRFDTYSKIRTQHIPNRIDKTALFGALFDINFEHHGRCFMGKRMGMSTRITMILLFVMMIFGSLCRGEEPTTAIALSDGSVIHLTPDQIIELLKQPGVEYSEVAIPIPEELGGGYIIGSEEDLIAAMETIEAIGAIGAASVETQTLTVTETGSGKGVVTSSPKGINCGVSGGPCSNSFKKGSKVSLTAKPDIGSAFIGWSGAGCSGTKPCKVTLDDNTTVTANFALGTPQIKVTPPSPKHFGNTKMGTKKSQTFTVKNEGTGNLTIGQITIINQNATNQYSVPSTNDNCSNKTVNPGKSCKFQVDFKPTQSSPQPLRGDVRIPSNDPNTPALIQLFGAGT
jgi:hypothetical protein